MSVLIILSYSRKQTSNPEPMLNIWLSVRARCNANHCCPSDFESSPIRQEIDAKTQKTCICPMEIQFYAFPMNLRLHFYNSLAARSSSFFDLHGDRHK